MDIKVIKVEVKTLSKSMFNQLEEAKCPDLTELIGQVNVPVTGGVIPEYILVRGDRLLKARHTALVEQLIARWVVEEKKFVWEDARRHVEEKVKELPQIFV